MNLLAEFHFLRPLWWLAVLPLLALVWQWQRTAAARNVLRRICDPALLPFVSVPNPQQARAPRLLPPLLAGLLAIAALAGPTAQRLPQPLFREESALVIALDLSASMQAQDVAPTRLSRAKFKIRDLLAVRDRGQTALVVFSGRAFPVTPLTDDVRTIESQLDVMEPELMPSPGTDVAGAVAACAALLTQAGYVRGDILLVTDGVPATQVVAVKQTLATHAFRLSVLGLGTSAGAPVPDGAGGFVKDLVGTIIMSRLEAGPLAALATSGRGVYLPARIDNTDVTALQAFWATQKMGDIESAAQRITEQWYELGPWLLGPVLALAALSFRRGALLPVLLLPMLLAPRPATARNWWFTPDQAGQRAFSQADYARAAQRFEDPAWRAAALYRQADYPAAAQALAGSKDPEAQYNRGNALARAGQLEDAVAAYAAALKQNPQHADAEYNKSLIETLLRQQGEPAQEPSKAPPKSPPKAGADGDEQQPDDGQAKTPAARGQDPGMAEPSDDKSAEKKPDGEAPDGDESSQAEQEAAAQAGAGGAAAARKQAAAKAAREAASKDEEEMSAEQWLRQVPDDPGGLWRRKFQYQYQRLYGGKSGSSEPW
ncbi:MAG: VWA domain-containing protein [Gammaproteobacteria bacterium]|nr:VWA domain-containing protein [Gammaproteobacteria bacterium]